MKLLGSSWRDFFIQICDKAPLVSRSLGMLTTKLADEGRFVKYMALQIENGQFTRISNEIIEQLVKVDLLASEYKIIWFVIRKTYGWQKLEDIISLTQFEEATDLSRHTVIDAVKNLVLRNILVKRSILGRQQIAYRFNKYHKTWVVNTTALVQNKMKTSAIERLKLVKRSAHTKEIQKKTKERKNLNSEAYKKWKERFGKK